MGKYDNLELIVGVFVGFVVGCLYVYSMGKL